MRLRLVLKSIILDDFDRPLTTLLRNVFSRAHHQYLNEDRPMLSAAKMYIRFMRISTGVPWRDDVKRWWGYRERRFSLLSYTISSEPYCIILFNPSSSFH